MFISFTSAKIAYAPELSIHVTGPWSGCMKTISSKPYSSIYLQEKVTEVKIFLYFENSNTHRADRRTRRTFSVFFSV